MAKHNPDPPFNAEWPRSVAGIEARPRAVALAYEAHSVAPRILAKGEGVLAEAILSRAKEQGIPLKVEPEVVSMLMQLDVDSYIPPALYGAIAEVLVWAYNIDARAGQAKLTQMTST
jgi:flagellar biosynthesis protein